MMTYDRDIRNVRRLAWALFAADLVMVVVAALARQWVHLLAALLWGWNARMWLRGLDTLQETRDLERLLRATLTVRHPPALSLLGADGLCDGLASIGVP